ncbi:ROK family transcriptional regulator [Deinococcus navajonensis]|uniref:ROK family transcriptional regulator n=1 Tax=Deinococcus navajonensis TaxID=309884 RepID=A0ABV8XND5_9DEIO
MSVAAVPATLDLAAIRARHTSLLLRLLWDGDRARVDIARDLGLSRSAISSIVSELIGVGLVEEGETRGSGRAGRRATLLSLNARAAALLAIDLGASHVRVDLMDLRCRPLASRTVPHEVLAGPAETYALVQRLVEGALQEAGMDPGHVALVGVGVPGPVDHDTGRVIRPPNMPGWDGEPVRTALQGRLGLDVLVDNDANLGAQAEVRFGPHRGVADLIYVKAATGIGAGVLLGGRLHRGVRGGAGEIGHISINEQGPVGRSGNPGSLESYAAAQVLVAQAEARRAAGADTRLRGPVTLPALVRHAETDPLAREIWEGAGHHLGVAISTTLNLFNPAVVVIGGRLAEAGPVFLNAARSSALSRTMQINAERTRIDLSTLGADAGVLGAGAMMLDHLLTPRGLPHLYAVSRASLSALPAKGAAGSRAPPAGEGAADAFSKARSSPSAESTPQPTVFSSGGSI